jgi:hypothetical protein
MSTYGKNKFSYLKWIIFAGAIIFAMAYMFTILAPKSSQMAKEEVLESLFGVDKKDTIVNNSDSIPSNKTGFYVNNDVDVEDALKKCFNYNGIEIIYVGIPESRIPTIIEGKLSWLNLSEKLRAKRVKFKDNKGNSYNVYVIYDRLTGGVADVANDERYIINLENKDTIENVGCDSVINLKILKKNK